MTVISRSTGAVLVLWSKTMFVIAVICGCLAVGTGLASVYAIARTDHCPSFLDRGASLSIIGFNITGATVCIALQPSKETVVVLLIFSAAILSILAVIRMVKAAKKVQQD